MRKSACIACLLAVFAFTSCKPKSSTPTPTGQGEAQAAAKATQAPLQMSLETVPAVPQMDQNFTLKVKVVNPAGEPVSAATLSGEISMKGMDHGKTPVQFEDKGGGTYTGTAKLPMNGEWELKVHAEQGAAKSDQVIPIKLGA